MQVRVTSKSLYAILRSIIGSNNAIKHAVDRVHETKKHNSSPNYNSLTEANRSSRTQPIGIKNATYQQRYEKQEYTQSLHESGLG